MVLITLAIKSAKTHKQKTVKETSITSEIVASDLKTKPEQRLLKRPNEKAPIGDRKYSLHREQAGHSDGKLEDNGFWKAYQQQQSEKKDFFEECNRKVGRLSGYTIEGESTITVPNGKALQFHAQKYQEKYGILILVTAWSNISTLLDTLNSQGPQYVGIITNITGMYLHESSHVTPLLFYLPGRKKKNQIECLILDSIAENSLSGWLMRYGIQEKKIFHTSRVRQADTYSCRTGALTLLRNALLYLKHKNHTAGFGQALQEAQLEDRSILSLPPEWDYTEQMSNKLLTDKHVVIRDYYSSKPEKRKQPKLAQKHRENHTEEKEFFCRFWRNGMSELITYSPPEDIEAFNSNEHCMNVNFKIKRKVNTYLLNKGARNKKQV